MINNNLLKDLCQCCIDSYEGEYGKVKEILKNVKKIEIGHISVFIGELDSYIVICFPGSKEFLDWVDNLRFRKTSIFLNKRDDIKVHEGFFDQYATIRMDIREEISNRDKNKKIFITGHSLGGALATLCHYYDYFYDDSAMSITFGSPRVGNNEFKKDFNLLKLESYRIVYGEDTITKVPTLWMKFKHVGKKIKLKKEYSFWQKFLIPVYKIFGNIKDHYPQRYLKGVKNLNAI